MTSTKETDAKVVLFDGVCILCNASVDFIVRHEKDDELKFASLQSDFGKSLIKKTGIETVPDSILFYCKGELFTKSKAVLHVCRYLTFPLNLLRIFTIIPTSLADLIYEWIAKNRYKWFGKKETCRIPTAEEQNKFLA